MVIADYDNRQIIPSFLIIGVFIAIATVAGAGVHALPVRSLPMLSYFLPLMLVIMAILTWRPKLAAPLIIVSVFFSPDIVLAQIPGRELNLRAEDGILAAALLALVFRHVAGRERTSISRTPLDKPILVYCFIGFLSTLVGAHVGSVSPMRGIFFLGKKIEYFVLFYLLYNCLEEKKDIRFAIDLVFICIFLVSVHNIYMRFMEADTVQWRGYGPPGIDDSYDYADMITLILPIMMAIAIETRSVKYIVSAAICTGPMIFMLFDTLVRHAYLGGIVTFLFLGVYRYRVLLLAMTGATVYAAARLPERIVERIDFLWIELYQYLSSGTFHPSGSFFGRINGLRIAFSEFYRRPLIGNGLGSSLMGSHTSHTQYSEILMETGLLGLGAFLGILVSAIRHASRYIRTTDDLLHRGFCIGYVAGLVGWLAACFATLAFSAIRPMECFIIVTAILMACSKEKENAGNA